MKIVAMDTTQIEGGLALLDGDAILAHSTLTKGAGLVVTLPEMFQAFIQKADWAVSDLDLIAVTLGPGGFTGLRIALGFAKGLSLSQNLPVVGVSTLAVIASGWSLEQHPRLVVMDARRGEVFVGLYQPDEQQNMQPLIDEMAWNPNDLVQNLSDNTTTLGKMFTNSTIPLIGSGVGVYGDLFKKALGSQLQIADEGLWHPDPVQLARLGRLRFMQRGADPVETLYPSYIRRSDAELTLMKAKQITAD
ncbi:MAG: tRNA (adenosine(37)-N6)-threonylcarbamoyltransferase complex dimerization subunit type 1 TsaB [Magnetococcales bacterium]|nr:tRNA (adenosine(37)-N6)-threonylcarbamoyltransferase complex dimerization subunit type 1 TsaB [Magnetococcales bacterium]